MKNGGGALVKGAPPDAANKSPAVTAADTTDVVMVVVVDAGRRPRASRRGRRLVLGCPPPWPEMGSRIGAAVAIANPHLPTFPDVEPACVNSDDDDDDDNDDGVGDDNAVSGGSGSSSSSTASSVPPPSGSSSFPPVAAPAAAAAAGNSRPLPPLPLSGPLPTSSSSPPKIARPNNPDNTLLHLLYAAISELSLNPTYLRSVPATRRDSTANTSPPSLVEYGGTPDSAEFDEDEPTSAIAPYVPRTGGFSDASLAAVPMSLFVRADLIDALLLRTRFRDILSDDAAAEYWLKPVKDGSRWPPYPVLRARFKTAEREDAVSPGVVDDFVMPTTAVLKKAPTDPRKAYEDALSTLDWGYWRSGIHSLAILASVGFLPAKNFFHPASSPIKNPTGMLHVARYLHETGILDVAVEWYRRAATAGDPAAQLELGRLLRSGGDGVVDRDDAEALVWLHKAWDATGNADAAFAIGKCFATAVGDQDSLGFGGRHWSSSSGGANGSRNYDGGDDDDEDEDEDDGADGTTGLAKYDNDDDGGEFGGLVKSMQPNWGALDVRLARGKPVVRDFRAAAHWLARAATLGHHGAECALGELRMAALVPVSAATAAGSSVSSSSSVAGSPLVGGGTMVDGAGTITGSAATPQARLESGFRLLKRAAVGGVPRAMFWVGWSLVLGLGVKVQEQEGKKWIQKAREAGFSEPDDDGEEDDDDDDDATLAGEADVGDLLREAQTGDAAPAASDAKPGLPSSASYFRSNDAETLRRAMRLLRTAANAGFPQAMYVLGLCHTRGFGVRKDIPVGTSWLAQAAEAGWDDWGGGDGDDDGDGGGRDPGAAAAAAAAAGIGDSRSGLTPHSTSITSKVSKDLIANAVAAALAATGGSALGGDAPLFPTAPTLGGGIGGGVVAPPAAAAPGADGGNGGGGGIGAAAGRRKRASGVRGLGALLLKQHREQQEQRRRQQQQQQQQQEQQEREEQQQKDAGAVGRAASNDSLAVAAGAGASPYTSTYPTPTAVRAPHALRAPYPPVWEPTVEHVEAVEVLIEL
ncbi:hypothetical protein DFJ73DRAFT_896294 [Zopfochytrium polystomum]|nr:hypothetical protein DFJ73DRAFT_896294 [Zopfochytrium polystomum]